MSTLHRVLLFAAVLSLLGPIGADAQTEVVRIDSESQCGSCEVHLDTVATVGSAADSALIVDYIGGLLVADGDTVVIGRGAFGGPNMVFAPDGRLIRTIGNEGQGPGELRRQIAVVPHSGNQVLVLQHGRLSVMDLNGDVSVERSATYKAPSAVSVDDDGRVLYSYAQYTPEAAGFRYQILGPELSPIRAFGRIPVEEQQGCQACRLRPSTWSQARPGHFWSVLPNRNQVELWSAEGERVLVLEIHGSEWFEPWDADLPDPSLGSDGVVRPRAEPDTRRPRPEFVSIEEDDRGLLWVTARAVPDDWEPYPGGIPTTLNPSPELREYLRRRWNTVIQVIDPDDREVVATRIFENYLVQPTGGGHFYRKSQNDIGIISYTVTRARLTR